MTSDAREALIERLKTISLAATDRSTDAASALFSACGAVLIDRFGPAMAATMLDDMAQGARAGARDAGVIFPWSKQVLVQ